MTEKENRFVACRVRYRFNPSFFISRVRNSPETAGGLAIPVYSQQNAHTVHLFVLIIYFEINKRLSISILSQKIDRITLVYNLVTNNSTNAKCRYLLYGSFFVIGPSESLLAYTEISLAALS